jgi:excinuclease UvrABC nuclease subunit
MPFPSTSGIAFTESGILTAPSSSGVYGVYNCQQWIYVSESADIQSSLFEHYRRESDQSACIWRSNPTMFTYELCDAYRRIARERTLIDELHPTCNLT